MVLLSLIYVLSKLVKDVACVDMEYIWQFNAKLNSIVWGPWMLALLLGTGVWFTFILGFPQIRYFKASMHEVFGRIFHKSRQEGSISSFAAMATALAATVGTGNIAGVATALHIGGPGALVWMLISAFFGMTTKFCEISLAVRYREKNEKGEFRGGTMYILEKALGMRWLALCFAWFALLAAFGTGDMIQANSTAEGFYMAFHIPHIYTAFCVMLLVGLVVCGGLTRVAAVATYLVPLMSIFYIAGACTVVLNNIRHVPAAVSMALQGAFGNPMAIPGALGGWAVKTAITKGIARGIFSNEAGLGSAPMVHCAAMVDHPCRQGLYGIFEVFADTIVICTLTVLAILTSGVLVSRSDLNGAQLTLAAFSGTLGNTGTTILSFGLALFALSTTLGWYWYGETALVYIFGRKGIGVYRVLFLALCFIGGLGGAEILSNIWDLSDTTNGLMAIPNLVGLLLLTKELRRLVKEFDTKRKSGELPK